MIKDELIKEYLKTGGQLYRITLVDSYRDGGTGLIETQYPELKYTIHKDNKTLHKGGMPCAENIVTNEAEIAYLVDQLISYQSWCLYKATKANELIKQFQ